VQRAVAKAFCQVLVTKGCPLLHLLNVKCLMPRALVLASTRQVVV
jgi:hypothetical protein